MSKQKCKKFRVWTEQINQMNFVVSATTEQEALQKAERIWKRNVRARATYVQPEL